MRLRVAVGAAWLVASGCLLFPDPGDLGGGQDATAPDAPSDVALDVAPDAPANGDAAPPDADAAPSDGGSEATTPFCAQHPTATFCADFDESSDAAAGFTNTYLSDGGIVGLSTSELATPPASLLAGNAALTSGQSCHGAEVRKTGVTPTKSLTLDMDFRVDALATQGSYVEAFAIVDNASTRSSVQLNIKSGSTEVGEELVYPDGGTNYIPHYLPAPLAMGKWLHVTIALDFQARTLTTTVDGTVVVDHVTISKDFAAGSVDLYVGNAYSPGPSSGASILYDDVLLVAN